MNYKKDDDITEEQLKILENKFDNIQLINKIYIFDVFIFLCFGYFLLFYLIE
jgi:hypothetical protein